MSNTIQSGQLPGCPVGHKRGKYEFGGWYAEPADTRAFGFIQTITANLGLYAKGRLNIIDSSDTEGRETLKFSGKATALLTFYYNYERGDNGICLRQEIRSGEKAGKPAEPARSFHAFEGWYLEPAGTTAFNFSQPVTKDTNLYAKWRLTAFGNCHYAYIVGFEDGTVRPQANLTRAQAATIFFRLLEEGLRRDALTKENSFTDVAKSDWYNKEVSAMAALGVVQGNPDKSYRGNDFITREEFAAITARFLGAGYSGPDKFADISSTWSSEFINAVAEAGWLLSGSDDTFRPKDAISRAEAMAIVNRVTGRRPQSREDLLIDRMLQ